MKRIARTLSPRSLTQPARVALVGSLVALVLAACGSHGTAPALASAAHVKLVAQGSGQAAGTGTLTPEYATHVITYLGSQPQPYSGAKYPVQVRTGACDGAVAAALTDNAPGPTSGQAPAAHADPAGGTDVAMQVNDGYWVTLLTPGVQGGASASLYACGTPLSGLRQYFDLQRVGPGTNGLVVGSAMIDPIIASRLDVDLSQTPSSAVHWSIHSDRCTGSQVASGQFPSGATHGAVIFHAPDTQHWWLAVMSGDGSSATTACGKVGA
jgi:hypothetical protein